MFSITPLALGDPWERMSPSKKKEPPKKMFFKVVATAPVSGAPITSYCFSCTSPASVDALGAGRTELSNRSEPILKPWVLHHSL